MRQYYTCEHCGSKVYLSPMVFRQPITINGQEISAERIIAEKTKHEFPQWLALPMVIMMIFNCIIPLGYAFIIGIVVGCTICVWLDAKENQKIRQFNEG